MRRFTEGDAAFIALGLRVWMFFVLYPLFAIAWVGRWIDSAAFCVMRWTAPAFVRDEIDGLEREWRRDE